MHVARLHLRAMVGDCCQCCRLGYVVLVVARQLGLLPYASLNADACTAQVVQVFEATYAANVAVLMAAMLLFT